MTLLKVKNLGVEFKDKQDDYISVVSDVSFEVKEGEIVGIVGESGSGKSVTALSLLKLLPYPKAKNSNASIVLYEVKNLLELDEKSLMKIRGKEISYIFQLLRVAPAFSSLDITFFIISSVSFSLRVLSSARSVIANATLFLFSPSASER